MHTKTLAVSRAARPASGARLADAILPLIIALIALVASLVEPRFASLDNLTNLACQLVPLLILSVGQAFAILRGGLDLSMSSVLSLAGVAGVLAMPAWGIPAGLAVMLAVGLAAGVVSGFIIARFRTTPLVVTLGMLSVTQAIALILSGGVPIYDVPAPYVNAVGFGRTLGLPNMVWIAAAVTLSAAFVLRRTVFGRYVYALGSSESAASKAGVNVQRYTVLVYAASGLCAAVGAVVLTAWTSSAQPVAVPGLTLQSIAAVVLGGVALTGGSGSIVQVFLGVLVLSVLSNAMNITGVSAYFQTLVVGVVIIIAVILDRFRRS
ncbi:branched-chain amino acid ABC transporter, permease protein [Bordetella bronchiseptica 99-R-0433]|uniref:ABC transporter permease n=1 Tax=Bordetella bronchiseptica TaxID=518 RepID=UPI0004599141|nr:ABC transporter permease [Bordetella bronchiseptica]KCV62990.1 branched-chain amino acid ABC transporter, permease protein [Bordetella bronchiseptica 99-R-0433]